MSGTTNPYVAAASAMTYADMQAQFLAILNRDDCTDTLAQTFLQQAIQRIQREARLPSMERLLVITPTAPMSFIDIPADLIQPIDLFVQSANGSGYTPPWLGVTPPPGLGITYTPLKHVTYRDLMRIPASDIPQAYARVQSQFAVRGWIPAGTETQLLYYGAFTPLASADSANELTASAPDLAIYAALSLAADYFQIEQGAQWEARYQQILSDVQGMSSDVDWSGGPMVIEPAYGQVWL